MKSLALWYKSKNSKPAERPKAEVHFNVWKLPTRNKSKFERFIDVGILLENAKDINSLFLYYPTKLTIDCVQDLGGKIVHSKDKNLVNTLFNANFNIKSEANCDYHNISSGNDDKSQFYIYVLKESNITVSDLNHGSRITIKFKGNVHDKIYIRIRIKNDYTPLFSHIDRPSNAFFQSAFSKTEIIDFRINEARELSNELLECIDEEGLMYNFSKIHFFFICSSREEYLFSHIPFISARQLEKDRWKDYIGIESFADEAILAYHWKVKEEKDVINDFNALVQTKYENNSFRTIVKYLLILLIITIAFNVLSSYIFQGLATPITDVKPNTTNVKHHKDTIQ